MLPLEHVVVHVDGPAVPDGVPQSGRHHLLRGVGRQSKLQGLRLIFMIIYYESHKMAHWHVLRMYSPERSTFEPMEDHRPGGPLEEFGTVEEGPRDWPAVCSRQFIQIPESRLWTEMDATDRLMHVMAFEKWTSLLRPETKMRNWTRSSSVIASKISHSQRTTWLLASKSLWNEVESHDWYKFKRRSIIPTCI